jgi:serine/threonine protein kinase
MAPLTSYGGNLIATLDFFRHGPKYYKVTEKVDLAGLEPSHVASLGFPSQLVLLKTVAHSLKILHDLEIVHSDLKPSNVMIKRTELGYTTKLIDFDSSYIVGSPPPPEDIVGTMNYYSPELVRYIQGARRRRS